MTKNVSVPEGYKITELGMMPEDWDAVEIGQLVDTVKNGFASGKRDENGIVQIRMNNVTTEGTIIFDKYLKVPIPKNIETFSLKKSDFLFNNTNSIDLVGKSAIFCEAPFDCTFSNHFTRIRFKQNLVLPEIILLNTLILWRTGFFKTVAIRHVGQAAVHSKYLLKRKIPLPPLPQQQKIASILSKVDEQIEQTEQIIEKTEILKKGLMQKLLTKGIGHTKFKKTELGEIPEEWEVGELSNISLVVMGQSPTGDTYNTTGEGKPLINGPSEFNERYPTPVKWTSKPTKVCKRGDILFCVRGNTLGRMNFADQEYCIGRGIAAIRGLKNLGDTNFVHMLLTKEGTELYRRANGEGSTFPNIKRDQLNEIKIAVPSLTEQQKIASILSKVDSQIQDNQNYLTRLQELKKGLMQDLLTGKVKVNV